MHPNLMRARRALAVAALLAASLAGCVAYPVDPGVYSPVPAASFDRSWAALRGAYEDQGVQILIEEKAGGTLRGRRGGININGTVTPQPDGTVKVQFHSTGNIAEDPSLVERVSQSYERRMGR
jgi:hypothetical protein